MAYRATIPQGYSVDSFPICKGIRIKGGEIVFDNSLSEKQISELLFSYWSKSVPNGNGDQFITKKLKPEMTKALKRADVEMLGIEVPAIYTDENYHFFKLSQANTRIDRAGDKLTKDFLQKLASGVMADGGISLLYNHNRDIVIGKVIHESVSKMGNNEDFELSGIAAIHAKATMPNHPNLTVKEGIDSGMLNWVSIGFRAIGEMKQVGDNVYQEFDYKEGQAFVPEHFETSLVYFPAQYGAKVKDYAGKVEEFDAVKTFSLQKISRKTFKAMIEIKANGKTFKVEPEVSEKDGATTATIKGLDGLQDEIKSLEADKAQLEKVKEVLFKTNEDVINDIQNLEGEKALNKSLKHSPDELKAMLLSSPENFKALATDLRKEYEGAIKTGRITAPGAKPETVVKTVENLW